MKPNYHEREEVVLAADMPIDRLQLDRLLKRRGFRLEDDFYHLQRSPRCPPWQSTTLLSLNLLRGGASIHETEDDLTDQPGTKWDQLQVGYLLATLPRECIEMAVGEIAAVAEEFNLAICLEGENVAAGHLLKHWNAIADHLSQEFGEPGSEWLAILIEQQY